MQPSSGFLWLPLAAVVVHLIEEFAWPGGFPRWYRTHYPNRAASVTDRFLVGINALLVVIALLPPLLGATPRGLALWMVFAGIVGTNAVFHLAATVRTISYSPGVITGALVYLPLAALGAQRLLSYRLASVGTALQALLIGIAYHVWAAWNHRRRAFASSLAA